VNLDLQRLIEQGGLSKIERLETILKGVQSFYLDELMKAKENLEVIESVLKQAPDLTNNQKPR
jgi:hypothetical protein